MATLVRTIHHLSSFGGTVISQCLAAMPGVTVLSEINPMSYRPAGVYNPMTPLEQFQSAHTCLSHTELKEFFLWQIDLILKKCQQQQLQLLIRDHSHSDFLLRVPRKIRSLFEFLKSDYDVQALITIRNPVDAYLSMQVSGFDLLDSFDLYCQRYLLFADYYSFCPFYRYEDFVDDPDSILQSICNYYCFDFDRDYRTGFNNIQLTGGSGRKSDSISRFERRSYSSDFEAEVQASASFKLIANRFGYSF